MVYLSQIQRYYESTKYSYKNIDLGQNRMALNIGHLKNGSVEFSSAGMPPLYMYNSKERRLKEILQVGLPLGSQSGRL